MIRRGLTLIEMLLALVLVAGLAAACAGWVATAADAIAQADQATCRAELQDALSVIRTDLQAVARNPEDPSERVVWRGDRLAIRCQVPGVGSAWVAYQRLQDGTLLRTVDARTALAGRLDRSVIVLHAVERFTADVAQVQPRARLGSVTIEIDSRCERSGTIAVAQTLVFER